MKIPSDWIKVEVVDYYVRSRTAKFIIETDMIDFLVKEAKSHKVHKMYYCEADYTYSIEKDKTKRLTFYRACC